MSFPKPLLVLLLTLANAVAEPPSRYRSSSTASDAAAPTAVADANVSTATPLAGDRAAAAATGKQERPQIARGTDTFLAVWADTRSALAANGTISVGGGGPYFGHGLGTMSDIYAARLDANGNVIDQNPIAISKGSYNQGHPQVAWNGQNWLVVWYEEVENNYYRFQIRAVRVSQAGVVLDATPRTIGPATSNLAGSPSVAFDGANWVVAWESFNANQTARSVSAARVAADGTVLDPQGTVVYAHHSQYLANPDLASTGSGSLLVFLDIAEGVIYGQRVSQTLQPIGARFVITGGKPTKVQVASNGADTYFVVWDEHATNGSIGVVKGARVSSGGQVLDQEGIIVEGNVGVSESTPSVAWDGTRWAVAYDSGYHAATSTYGQQDIYLRRVTSNGAVVSGGATRVSAAASHQTAPAIALGLSGAVQLVWNDARVEQDIYTAKVSSTNTVTNERAASLAAPRQSRQRMAFGANVFLTVFQREIAGSSHVYAQRLDANGDAIDAEPFRVSATDNLTNATPSVAFNGTHFLVVWSRQENDDIGNIFQRTYGRRITPAGTLVEAAPFFVMEGETPDVAALGETFLTVAIRRIGQRERYVESVRVSGAGALVGTPRTILGAYNFAPRVTALGNRWLVVWQYHSRHDSFQSWIRGSFVEPEGGTATESFQIAMLDQTNPGYSSDNTPHLAASGNEALVVWNDNDNNTNDIKGRRIDLNGTLLGSNFGFEISSAPGSQFLPAVSWDGSQYVVTWVDQRDEQYPVQPRGDIYATRVSQSEAVLDPAGFAVANSAAPEETPFVSSAPGTTIFSYSAFYDSPFSAMRVAVRRSTFTSATVVHGIHLPASAPRGSAFTGSVALSSAAPAGGRVVALQSQDPSIVSVPAEVTVPAGATSAAFSGYTGGVTNDTPVAVNATSAGVTSSDTMTVNAQSSYAQWQQANFDSQSSSFAAASAEAADPEGDGRSNLFEYATGSDPRQLDLGPAVSPVHDAAFLSLVYTRRIGATDVTFTIKQSTSLPAGWTTATPTNEVQANGDGVTETVRAKVPTNGASGMFLRLEISR